MRNWLYLNPWWYRYIAWNFKSLTTLKVRSNWRGKSTTCTWCHWINLIWTMRPSRYFKYLLPQFSTLLLLFIIQLCHITNGLMSPEDVSRDNFDKNIVNTWLACFSHNGLKPFLKKHCYSCVLLYINISSVLEFQRWWVLKSMIFGQESTYSKASFLH